MAVEAHLAAREAHRSAAEMRRHWWYRGRQAAVASVLRRARVPRGGPVLDFGCGTGHMGSLLASYGPVTGVDASRDALELGDFRAYESVHLAWGPDDPEFPRGAYRLVSMLDVLEHVPDDQALLRAMVDQTPRDGRIMVSVPMDPSLFCAVDELAGHQRRYTREALADLAEAAGLECEAATGYVVALLPLARRQRRRVMAGRAQPQDELRVPGLVANATLSLVAVAEGKLARWRELPEGLSWIAVFRRRRCP